MTLPKDKDARKTFPMKRGLLDYFPAALAQVAHVSHVGNEQHNPGEELYDNREKSNDDLDCALRHLVDHGYDPDDEDGLLHLAKAAWRVLRALQKYLEDEGHPLAPAARFPSAITWQECENNIDQRIAGDDEASKRVKNLYYRGE